MSSEFRAYLKPKGANPEIDSSYYELSSQEKIHGMWNCEILTLGYVSGNFMRQMLFRPLDHKKPIVFAIDGVSDGTYFVVVDAHIRGKKHDRMVNFKPYKTDKYIIDCDDGCNIGGMGSGPRDYWTIRTGGETYSFGHPFPNTWVLFSVDPLCAFVGGGMTANQLRAHAYRQQREAQKEMRRENHIQFLRDEERKLCETIDKMDRHIDRLQDEKYVQVILIREVRASVEKCWLPGRLRSKLTKLLDQFDGALKDVERQWKGRN